MQKVNNPLPHHTDRLFLTDGGIETWLMYKRGFELKHFCAFDLLNDPAVYSALREYYRAHAEIALKAGVPFIFDSLTYRSSGDWGGLLGYSPERPRGDECEGVRSLSHNCLRDRV